MNTYNILQQIIFVPPTSPAEKNAWESPMFINIFRTLAYVYKHYSNTPRNDFRIPPLWKVTLENEPTDLRTHESSNLRT